MRNDRVEPFGETVQQVYARISALRNALGGPTTVRAVCRTLSIGAGISLQIHAC